MIKELIVFGAGVYTGVYIAQNYQIDKVENPTELFAKARAFISEKIDIGDAKKGDDDSKKCK